MQVIYGKNGGLIKAWIDGVSVEEQARAQLDNIAAMPFIRHYVGVTGSLQTRGGLCPLGGSCD